MESNYKKTISHTSIYTLGVLLRNGVSIVMLPIYTRYLTPEDYGVVELLSMVTDFVGIILCYRIGDAVFRFHSEASTLREKHRVVSSSFFLAVLINTLGFIIICLFSTYIALNMFGDVQFSRFIILFSIIFMLEALINIPLIYIRIEQKPYLYLAIGILKLTLQVGLNVYFVVIKNMHVEGVIYSGIITTVIMSAILSIYLFSKIKIYISYLFIRKIILFSYPLAIATLGSFYLTYGDRYFLRLYVDLTEVGIYSLGYKFGFIFTMLAWEPFSKIWDVEKYNIYKLNDSVDKYQRTFIFYNLYIIVIALIIAIFVEDLLKIMSDSQFWSAYEIVPIILLSYVIWIWTKYCDLGILIKKDTKQYAYGEFIAVIVITVGYLTLIPLYGRMGAAYATLIGFIARFLWIYYQAKKIYDMKLQWVKICYIVTTAISIYLVSMAIPENIILSFICRILLLIIFVVIVFTLPVFSKSDRNHLLNKPLDLFKRKMYMSR